MPEITILFDNHNPDGDGRSLWGFAAYVHAYKLLFDTGSNGRVLLRNMQRLGIDIGEVERLFISHEHWDHIGGVDSVLEANSHLTIYAPRSLSKNMVADMRTQSHEVIVCRGTPVQLTDTLYSTGVQGKNTPEHALIIDGETPTVVTGCGHYGIDRITARAAHILGKPIHAAIGGFHLYSAPSEDIEAKILALKNNGVQQVMPTHCSGDEAIERFRQGFGGGFHDGGIGANCMIRGTL
jgi:7,8-dihydropterin-6-yl-methyl-4-(beta-D-ribofuranosyl)aminobenzene 5'-phosphate synthase